MTIPHSCVAITHENRTVSKTNECAHVCVVLNYSVGSYKRTCTFRV